MIAKCSDQRRGAPPPFFVGDSEDGMAHIFSYLNFKDLSACRLVSKFWFDVSLRFWVAEAGPMKLSEKRTSGNRDNRCAAPAMTIAKFLKRIHDDDDESCDYSKYKSAGIRQLRDFWLEFKEMPRAEPESKRGKLKLQFKRLSSEWRTSFGGGGSKENDKKCCLLKEFLTYRGSWITCLTLDYFTFPDVQTFENVMYCKFTPELKDLTIFHFRCDDETPTRNSCHNDDEELNSRKESTTTKITSLYVNFVYKKGRLPVGWTDFLEHYPALKSLGICSCNNNENWDILDAISQLRETDKTKLQLTELNVNFAIIFKSPERLLAFYQQAQLPLTKLDICAFGNTTIDFAFDLINLHSSALKELDITNLGAQWNHRWNPPLVESLQKLQIWGLPVFRDLGFLNKFPNLEFLKLWRSAFREGRYSNLISSTSEDDMEGLVLPSLRNFDYGYEERCGPAEIRKIVRWMPNLRWLDIAVTEDGRKAVLESSWSQPDGFSLRGQDDDEGVVYSSDSVD